MPSIMLSKAKGIMKKLLRKLHRKEPTQPPSSRITNETVAAHRERILAGGRRFKYPIQYARHRLVFNAIIISVAALVILAVIGWWQLYPAQNTSTFMYRVTKVLPLPVASVDGQPVPYSDYLMRYLSSVHYLEQKEQISLKTDDGKRQVDFIKQQAMQDSIADAYARKLAAIYKVTVSDAELQAFLIQQRQSSDGEVSVQTSNAVVLDYYGWTPDEYQYATKNTLLRQKVAFAVDDAASKKVQAIAAQLKDPNANLQAIAAAAGGEGSAKVLYSAPGWVPKTNQDGGLALAASKLQKSQISSVVKSTTGDGYYFIKLLDSDNTRVSYEYIQIPLTTFKDDLAKLIAAGKVHEYISIPKAVNGQ